MVDEKIERRIQDILRIYMSKMDSRDLFSQGMNYVKQLSQGIDSRMHADNPESMVTVAELYIWIKMMLLASDVSEDMLNSKIDRLIESINNS